VANIVDLSGGGDIFAAGALFGLESGLSLVDCASLGCVAAREVIQTVGSHTRVDMVQVAKDAGLL